MMALHAVLSALLSTTQNMLFTMCLGLQTAKDIVDLITGKRIATDSVLVDAAQMKFQTVLTYDTSVSMHERAKACISPDEAPRTVS